MSTVGSTSFTKEWGLETVSSIISIALTVKAVTLVRAQKGLAKTGIILKWGPCLTGQDMPLPPPPPCCSHNWAPWISSLKSFFQLHLLSRSLMIWLLWSLIARCCSTWSSNSKMVSFRFFMSASFSDVFSCSFWLVLLSCSACRSHTSFSWPYSFSACKGGKKAACLSALNRDITE